MAYDPEQKNLQTLKTIYAESRSRIIFFTGAGCSVDAGLPLWNDLKKVLFEEIDSIVRTGIADDEELEKFRELEELYNNGDYWKLFELAEENWPTTYGDVLQEQIVDKALNGNVPILYKKMWSMRFVNQIVTLNLDGFVSKAFSSLNNKGNLLEYDGHNASDSKSFIERDLPCCINLHGLYNSKTKWIMNNEQRQRLYKSSTSSFSRFMTGLYENFSFVFIGINIKDVTISPFLRACFDNKLGGAHFWITHDERSGSWCQAHGVRQILYRLQSDPKHGRSDSADIISILDDLEKFRPDDPKTILPDCAPRNSDINLSQPNKVIDRLNTNRELTLNQINSYIVDQINIFGYNSGALQKIF